MNTSGSEGLRPWAVELTRSAANELDTCATVSEELHRAALDMLAELSEDPFTTGAIPLRGSRNLYRVRLPKNYRLVYQVLERSRRVVVTRIRAREDVYAGL